MNGSRHRRWLAWARRALNLLFLVLVPLLLWLLARNLQWQEVSQAVRGYSAAILLLAVAITILSFALYSCYDLLAGRYARHRLPARQVLALAFVVYAFNLNLGAWVGAVALRYRLYSRLGLGSMAITRILSFSLATNWLGYLLLAGTLFALGMVQLPGNWAVGSSGLRVVGGILLMVPGAYLLACRYAKRRAWHWRGQRLQLPTAPMALAQLGLSLINWTLPALVVFLLLPDGVGYPQVLGVMLISSIAGIITHIPAGLGVLEAVFITMLQHQLGKGAILAALLGYRAIYLLLPLALASLVYLALEQRARALRNQNRPQP
ncbi:lysylphosphatidylglycerol synthase domain-containing protein [Pseudomonas sp. L5B5]|uniref:lysylphosphatidylglycerol synthase domain-containing protein n=1 Tax=Pseudomonas sp. L5B5 TaxID=2883205 RepID=UPI001CF9E5B7|nr:lysylphosphatidylglycerol synthase domain-containing protein [Pseudomonas sp. L5B5]UCZ85468.1 lysylphosphatidylglycerol synthase domain-containing protein [Pseudomonas sp. L5B5]